MLTGRDILHRQPFNLLWTYRLESGEGFAKPSEVVFKEASPLRKALALLPYVPRAAKRA